MDYTSKYLKYKNKYLELRKELIAQGVNVDEMMGEAMNKLSSEPVQTGGNDEDIFIPSQEFSEMNLTETPNVFDQEGGDVDSYGIDRPLTEEQSKAADAGAAAGAAAAIKAVSPSAAPVPNPQKSTTTTNVRNVYNYFDPLYPTYTVPGYNTVVTTTPLYTVPVNTFPVLKRNNDFFLDDSPVRRTSRRTSRRKSSRRISRKSSRRKSSRRSSRKSSRK
jgi:hypothetical protein